MGVHKLDTIHLKGDESTTVQIGLFESTIPIPEINIVSHPDIGDRLGVSLTKRDEGGDYVLLCQLQNLSAQACTVTIRSAE